MDVSNLCELLRQLVAFPSVSRTSNRDVTDWISDYLSRFPFRLERVDYVDAHGVEKTNLVASCGSGDGGMLFCAHNDVVPADRWDYPHAGPFELHREGDRVYGRGSCDMKGPLACFLAAVAAADFDRLRAPLSLICTADEEVGYHGAAAVAERSPLYRDFIAQQPVAVIGEPTSLQVVHAHKGIVVFRVVSRGRAGHSSTSAGVNANLAMIPFLQEMADIEYETRTQSAWQDERFDPPTISWNIGINDFTYATNVTPEQSICTVSFRPMPGQDPDLLLDRVREAAASRGLEFTCSHAAAPLFVDPQSAHIQDLLALSGQSESHTVTYGTDGAMFQDLEKLVICGPGNIAQAHTVDEWIAVDQLAAGLEWNLNAIEHFCY